MNSTALNGDVADLPVASYWPDVAIQIDRGEMTLEEAFQQHQHLFEPLINQQAASYVNWILETIDAAPTFAIGVLAVNILLNRSPYSEISLHKWARRLGTTKKTISQFIVTQRDQLNLRPVGTAKSNRARQEFRKSQKAFNEKNRINGHTRKRRDSVFDFETYWRGLPKKTASGDQEAPSEVSR